MKGTSRLIDRGTSTRAAVFVAGLLSLFLAESAALRADPFDIVLSEIHYNPADGARGEFVEIRNTGTRPVALGGWRLRDAVAFTFPDGAVIFPGEHLAIALDSEHLRRAAGLPAGDRRVIGNFDGRLGDGGEKIELLTPEALTVFQVVYKDGDPWPEEPDGHGPSLELRSILDDADLPSSWMASRTLGGTPARANSSAVVVERRPLLARGVDWRYRKGLSEPSGGDLAWTRVPYNDGGWLLGPTPIGLGAGEVITRLDDLPGAYSTVYLRAPFDLPEAGVADRLRLAVSYQDGFVAYINGHEVARRGLLAGPGPLPFAAIALEAIEPASEVFDLSAVSSALVAGENILAVHVANDELTDGRLLVAPELFLLEEAEAAPAIQLPLRINEVKGGADGFVEVINISSGPIDLGGLILLDLPLDRKLALPGGPLEGGARRVFPAASFVGPPLPAITAGVMTLLAGEAPAVLADALDYRLLSGPGTGRSFGRFPDGGEDGYVLSGASPGGANQASLHGEVVINEIHYHPAVEGGNTPPIEFLEIYNRSAGPIDLSGWRFTRGIPFSFPAGRTLSAGGFLVIAPDPAAVEARYGISGVLGGFAGGLQNSAEVIRLEDDLGNPADRLRYADDGGWPAGPDGGGNTLELRHPSLDNRLGLSWAASTAGGTPGAPNSAREADPGPSLGEISHNPAVPSPSDPVTVAVAASDDAPGLLVALRWRREGEASYRTVSMKDDGKSGDGEAGDGVFGAAIPPQADGVVVQFYGEATDAGGKRSTFPRSAPDPVPLFIVDGSADGGALARFHVVMTRGDRRELESRPVTSNVFLDSTVIYAGRAHYNAGIRYRGNSSRGYSVKSFRIEVSHADPLDGVTDLVLNGRNLHNQRTGMDFFRRAGLPYCRTQFVNLSLNESDLGMRLRMEHVDDDYIAYHFPGREGGNLYRGRESATLAYQGANQSSYDEYDKENNLSDASRADIVELCDAFANSTDAQFPGRIAGLIDVPEWIRFFAAQDVLSNQENGIWRDTGDDFFIYRLPATASDSQKWSILPWDFDDILGDPAQRVPRVTVAAPLRLVRDGTLGGPSFFCEVRSLAAGPFSPAEMESRIQTLAGLFPDRVGPMETASSSRARFLAGLFSTEFTAEVKPGDFIPRESSWRFWKGETAPPGGLEAWRAIDYDDSTWSQGDAGIGFDDGDDNTILNDMRNGYTTVFIRRVFDVPDPSALGSLSLMIDYDDGFVAYLNGQRVAFANYDGPEPVPEDETATTGRDAGTPVEFPLDDYLDLLRPGRNVLAIVGLNVTIDNRDFSLSPWLVVGSNAAWGCGTTLFASGTVATLTGNIPLCRTAAVTVNGLPAEIQLAQARWSLPVTLDQAEERFLIENFGPAGELLGSEDVLIFRAGSSTTVGGTLGSNATWTAQSGPYLLASDVTITAGATLTIEPGVTVLLGSGATLVVRGKLAAGGTAVESVRFARMSCAGRWGGIAVLGSAAEARIAGAVIEQSAAASDGSNTREGCVASSGGSRLDIFDCLFRGCSAPGVSLLDGRGLVEGNEFLDGPGAIRVEDSQATVRGNRIRGASGAAAIVVRGGAEADGSVERNRIDGAEGDGIVLDASRFAVVDNTVAGAREAGLHLTNGASPRLERNVVYFCGSALAFGAASAPAVDHMTMAYNETAIAAGGPCTIENSIVWGNFELASGDPEGLSFRFSAVGPQDLPPGPGNIGSDPLFVDFLTGDFSLAGGSPAIGAADDGADIGAIPYEARGGFTRGDATGDGRAGITDAIAVLQYLFRDGAIDCEEAADANDDGYLDIADPVRLLLALFAGVTPLAPPFPACGPDPTPDGLVDCGRECR